MLFGSVPMQKVRIMLLAADKDRAVEYLHDKGMIEIRKSKLSLQDDMPSQRLYTLSDLLIKVDGALALLRRPKKLKIQKHPHYGVDRLVENVRLLGYVDRAFAINDRRRELNEDMAVMDYAMAIAGYFNDLDVDFSNLKSETLSFKAFRAQNKVAAGVGGAIQKHGINAETVVNPIDKRDSLVLVAYPKSVKLDDAIGGMGMTELDLNSKYLVATPSEVVNTVKVREVAAKAELDSLQLEMDRIGDKYYAELLAYREMLDVEVSRAEVVSEFKKTDATVVLEGWVPQNYFEGFSNELVKFLGGRCYVEGLKVNHEEEPAPTLGDRPKWLGSFDYLMEFYSVPKSSELDPTWIFILSFPIFYGLMISDVGYGIASFALATWIVHKTDPDSLIGNTAKLWQLCAIFAVVFGVLSNQYLGFQLGAPFSYLQLFDWVKNATSVMVITIYFGLTQVILGLVFGFINKYREHETKLAISKLTSIAVVIAGTIAVAGFFFGQFGPATTDVAALVAVVAFIASAALSGIEAAELTNLITHPLSYTRILGFGMASVIIAFLIDNAFTPNLGQGIVTFILFLIIFLVLHFVNLVLGIFEGLVQGVRLNFVEFFSKFYEGGGVKFKPFSYTRKYTE